MPTDMLPDVAVPTIAPRTRKIALIGYAPNVRMAPWNDKTYEIWGLNDQPWTMPRIDVLFELHKPEVIKEEGHWDRLKELSIPIFMQDKYDEIPSSIKYPLDVVAKCFRVSGTDRPYLTCSASEMLAVALLSTPQPARIDVFGIDMAQDTEFGHQRPSAEFWLGIAFGRGIELSVQYSSDLLKANFIYGFEDEPQQVVRAQHMERRKFLADMRQQALTKEQQAHEERLQYEGALADIDHVIKRWTY